MQLLGTASDLAIGVKTLGQIEKTITGLSYAAFPDLRRGALIMHNKQEGHNALKAEIAFGNKGIYRLSVEGAVHVRHALVLPRYNGRVDKIPGVQWNANDKNTARNLRPWPRGEQAVRLSNTSGKSVTQVAADVGVHTKMLYRTPWPSPSKGRGA